MPSLCVRWKMCRNFTINFIIRIAEIELNILSSQCLDRCIGQKEFLSKEVTAWEARRNQRAASTNRQFTTQDARIKLKHPYPSL